MATGDDSASLTGAKLVLADYHTKKTPPLRAGEFDLITLSTLPGAVTGGDVLVALRGLADGDSYTLTSQGVDVTASVHRVEDVRGGEVRGLITGLDLGDNQLVATARGSKGIRRAALTVTNHPITGPVISGPHQTPFVCQTQAAGLGEPLDADCSIETRYDWYYLGATNQQYQHLDDPYANYPADVAQTTTADGRTVPFVVRLETSTINRGITRIAVLDDPQARGRGVPFDARIWNRRVFYYYGASCGAGYHQGVSAPSDVLGGVGDIVGVGRQLGAGDAVVGSTLSIFGVHCNPLVSIETATMVKEHINEQYGLIEDMVSSGVSGGAIQQYNAINNAPGLLSAALPSASFPDVLAILMSVADCALLTHYYDGNGQSWDSRKRALVEGHDAQTDPPSVDVCGDVTTQLFPIFDPQNGCDSSIPPSLRYDPVQNPHGARCTVQDANVNLFGRDPKTGFARRPLDNTGVQYGLEAFNRGVISAEEFLDVNRTIGGLDIDGHYVAQRMKMDPEVESIAYRTGIVVGRGALAETPVMDTAPYVDLLPPIFDIHEGVRPFSVRARLRAQMGEDATQAIWRGIVLPPDAHATMDRWLPALRDLPYGADRVKAVIAAKPAMAEDRCLISTKDARLQLPESLIGPFEPPLLPRLPPEYRTGSHVIDVPEDFDSARGPCSLYLPYNRTPRMAAGMPLSDDVIRCQLEPVHRNDYPASMTDAQFAELHAIFPDGVCDWSKPAAGDVKKSVIWPSLGDKAPRRATQLKYWAARSVLVP